MGSTPTYRATIPSSCNCTPDLAVEAFPGEETPIRLITCHDRTPMTNDEAVKLSAELLHAADVCRKAQQVAP